jgi:hypothetical protein
MSSQNTIQEAQNSTASSTTNNTTYHSAAGVYCQLPLVNYINYLVIIIQLYLSLT